MNVLYVPTKGENLWIEATADNFASASASYHTSLRDMRSQMLPEGRHRLIFFWPSWSA